MILSETLGKDFEWKEKNLGSSINSVKGKFALNCSLAHFLVVYQVYKASFERNHFLSFNFLRITWSDWVKHLRMITF